MHSSFYKLLTKHFYFTIIVSSLVFWGGMLLIFGFLMRN
ncbi:Uncharacterised protein [Serratia quinivorans]|nr:Uncharacterised protein [Serratia quinivorans]